MPLPCAYQPRDAERGVLYRVVEAHVDAFLDAAADHAEGARLPMFVEQEFRDPDGRRDRVVLATISRRVRRVLRRQGFDGDVDLTPADPVTAESAALAGISSASIKGRVALGRRAGARVWRVGDEPDAPWVFSSAPRHAHLDGFDLHANIAVPAGDRPRLEQLCRYLLRPAVAQERLRLLGDGRVLLTLKTAWADGTRHLLFEPLELLEKLAALTPRPRINLVLTTASSRPMRAGAPAR
jgi:hypothetical protein